MSSSVGRFNSCMVQLKLSRVVLCPITLACFNSCMVQLKCRRGGAPTLAARRFNSCMVQLKSCCDECYRSCRGVLIPVWCNWNRPRPSRTRRSWCFNSCMVQLKFGTMQAGRGRFIGFNSCMVQLKWGVPIRQRHPHDVLIPVWCNWNRDGYYHVIKMFGFNSCMVQLKYAYLFFCKLIFYRF